MDREPTRIIGLIVAAVTAVIGVLVSFGVAVTQEQSTSITIAVAAVLTAVGALGSWLQAVWTRRKVSPA